MYIHGVAVKMSDDPTDKAPMTTTMPYGVIVFIDGALRVKYAYFALMMKPRLRWPQRCWAADDSASACFTCEAYT